MAASTLASGKEKTPSACPSGREHLLTQEPMVRNRLARANGQQQGRERLLGRKEAAGSPMCRLNAPEERRGCVSCTGAPQRMGVVWLSLSCPVPWLQAQKGGAGLRLVHRHTSGQCACSETDVLSQLSGHLGWLLPPSWGYPRSSAL